MNGIVINNDFHEAIRKSVSNASCRPCSLYEKCAETNYSICFADLFGCGMFVNRGKVNIVFPAKSQPEAGCIYSNGVKKIKKEE